MTRAVEIGPETGVSHMGENGRHHGLCLDDPVSRTAIGRGLLILDDGMTIHNETPHSSAIVDGRPVRLPHFRGRGAGLERFARELEKAREILAEEGLLRLGARSASKGVRILQRLAGIGPEVRSARQAIEREKLLQSVADELEKRSAGGGAGATRSSAETVHLIRHHCQECPHFRGSNCSRMTSRTGGSARNALVKAIVDPAGRCPEGIWPSLDAPSITRLNLVYFICPMRHPERIWQWNVSELLRRIHVFNGRRIITVASDGAGENARDNGVDPPEAVVAAFAGHDVEFRFVANDPRLGEAPHFLPAMREIASTNRSEAVFYAHAKGVSRRSQVDELRAWTAAMYHHNLDRANEIADLLRRWPCAGIAKTYGFPEAFLIGRSQKSYAEGGRPWHAWHYAGTFWWVRHDALFSRPDWEDFEVYNYATEKYLANFFRADEAFCLAYDDCGDPRRLDAWRPQGDAFDPAVYALQFQSGSGECAPERSPSGPPQVCEASCRR